jgi:ankyrin repeat protein
MSAVSRSWSCSWIQLIVIAFFVFQFFLIYSLYMHHSFFQQPLYDHEAAVIPHYNPERDSFLVAPTNNSTIRRAQYKIFPASINLIHNTDFMPTESKKLLEYLLGYVPEIDFPDLFNRPADTIRSSLPRLFQELPETGFLEEYKNPCWYRPAEQGQEEEKEEGHHHQQQHERELVCLPFAYLLGQPKAGTSDLFERVKAHPKVIPPTRKEVRWFTRGEFARSALPREGEEADRGLPLPLPAHEKLIGRGTSLYSFTSFFRPLARALLSSDTTAMNSNSNQNNNNNNHNNLLLKNKKSGKDLISIDGGPHTLWWPTQAPDGSFLPLEIPPPQLIREIHSGQKRAPKFLITLTDPVKRLYSDYYFLNDDLKPVRPNSASASSSHKSAEQLHERVKKQIGDWDSCIESYLRRLVPQYREKQKKNKKNKVGKEGEKEGGEEEAEGKRESLLLREFPVTLVNPTYRTYFPLWFRSAQACAHDRHVFGKGGWGRLNIGLYVLYLEKWLEQFSPEQFLVVRLEDYEKNPREYMSRVFSFLGLNEEEKEALTEEDWTRITVNRHFNEHRVPREPLLEETELLLREFYRPFNQLLSGLLRNQSFLWEEDVRKNLLEELRRPVHDFHRPPSSSSNGKSDPNDNNNNSNRVNQHSPEREDHLDNHNINNNNQEQQQEQEQQQGKKRLRHSPAAPASASASGPLVLRPKDFSLFDLPLSFGANGMNGSTEAEAENEAEIESSLKEAQSIDFTDRLLAGKFLCKASFSLDLPLLRFLLHDIGIPADTVYQQDSNRNAFHCLAALWTMAEAHSRSHIFAELKGKRTWLSAHLRPPLPEKMNTVLSRDITERLAQDVLAVAQWLARAGVPHSTPDNSGYSPLHHAATGGLTALVSFLIGIGASVSATDKAKRTALHYAAAYGRAEICSLLSRAGADLNQKDVFGVTPLDIIANPGPISAADAWTHLGVKQRPIRSIQRKIHPELTSSSLGSGSSGATSTNETRLGWWAGTGDWEPTRLKGFEDDMTCDTIDQYFADEITAVSDK